FGAIEALKQHRNAQRAVGTHRYRLAPMFVQKVTRGEREKAVEQTAERLGQRRLDRGRYDADIVGQRMRLQREARHHAEAAAASPPPRAPPPPPLAPQKGPGAVPRLTSRCAPPRRYVSRLQQQPRRRAELLREAAKTAALHKTRDADRRTAAALNVAAALRRH